MAVTILIGAVIIIIMIANNLETILLSTVPSTFLIQKFTESSQ